MVTTQFIFFVMDIFHHIHTYRLSIKEIMVDETYGERDWDLDYQRDEAMELELEKIHTEFEAKKLRKEVAIAARDYRAAQVDLLIKELNHLKKTKAMLRVKIRILAPRLRADPTNATLQQKYDTMERFWGVKNKRAISVERTLMYPPTPKKFPLKFSKKRKGGTMTWKEPPSKKGKKLTMEK